MIRAMYSGITGLKANQTKLDVIGNNIANVGTTSFKTQRIRFQDMLSQSMSEATGPSTTLGGTNPSQVGLGTQVAGIDTITTQGNLQPTSRNLDFAVDGSGYFVVAKGKTDNDIGITVKTDTHTIDTENEDEGNFQTFFTRDGSFTLDEYGQLINSDGMRVMGYAIDESTIQYDEKYKPFIEEAVNVNEEEINALEDKLVPLAIPDEVAGKKVRRFTVEKNGLIKVTLTDNTVRAIGQIAMASFKNTAGLYKEGKNLYSVSANSGEAVFRSGVGVEEAENNNELGYGNIVQGALEMSNVDLAEQFTEMIVASRAFQANGKIITTSDEILQDLVNLKR
ncbi:flagellar basal-body rod protein FlgG [Clostridium acetireducens DSM 10703]|uniref:Flagellar hook protein FlgE n=1 Tax=Clostridium acetireducens DSM 10703 TaxID=1121290 RepID=A0A1E8F055_9CLOT|nr:flagellar hook-basal body complex protein [Clostridium acetireducens]OFI06812.1 flagellar basal-body rod protein FlgG [Clostridium acetireducens DSM 10703]